MNALLLAELKQEARLRNKDWTVSWKSFRHYPNVYTIRDSRGNIIVNLLELADSSYDAVCLSPDLMSRALLKTGERNPRQALPAALRMRDDWNELHRFLRETGPKDWTVWPSPKGNFAVYDEMRCLVTLRRTDHGNWRAQPMRARDYPKRRHARPRSPTPAQALRNLLNEKAGAKEPGRQDRTQPERRAKP